MTSLPLSLLICLSLLIKGRGHGDRLPIISAEIKETDCLVQLLPGDYLLVFGLGAATVRASLIKNLLWK
jgi:hypothetical protein